MSTKCKLFPYKYQPITSVLSDSQQYGWNITSFGLPKVWEKTQGEGVIVAVIDTGCDLTHPDLKDNLVEGYNFIDEKKPPMDDKIHGTHVSGIICASNNSIGMVGVAPKAKVMPIKALDSKGNGTLETVSKAIRYAVDKKVDIICMSLGSPSPLQQVRKAIKLADQNGIPVFVAAGNAGKTQEVFYPAAYPETIAIGSIDSNFNRSDFSNTGKNLDFMAPGGKIFSTIPSHWYGILSGTSMACPYAAGIAALMLSYSRANNNCIKLENTNDYREEFKKHTTPIKSINAGDKFFEGFGIIDISKL